MDANAIGWIITGVVLFFIIWSVIMGIIRGFGKSLFRLVWLGVTLVILYFVMPSITSAINNVDISSLQLDVYGEVTTVSDIGTNLFNNLASESEALMNNQFLQGFIESLPALIINVPLFIVLFWLTKWILWPIWAILASVIFDKQKRERKKFEKEQAKRMKRHEQYEPMPVDLKINKKKHRIGGAIVGLVIGIVISAVTFMPVIGFNGIYQEASQITITKDDGSEVTVLEDIIKDEQTLNILSFYETSFASKIFTYTGTEYVSNFAFKEFTSVKINDEKIYITDEVSSIFKVYDKVIKLKDTEITISSIGELLDDLLGVNGSKLVKNTINSFVDYALDKAVEGSEQLKELKTYIDEIKNNIPNVESFKTELGYVDSLVNTITKTYDTNKEKFVAIGEKFDEIKDSSKLVTRDNINSIMTFFFDKIIDESEDLSEFEPYLEDVKNNIPNIESYKTEFSCIMDAVDALSNASETNNLVIIGREFDKIKSTSKLITGKNINDMILHFYDKATETTTTEEYQTIISSVRTKIEKVESNNLSYEETFNEMNKMIKTAEEFSKITSLEAFENFVVDGDLEGEKLDAGQILDKMQDAFGQDTTYEVADTLINVLLNSNDVDEDKKKSIQDALEKNNFFDYKENKDEIPEKYYENLVKDILGKKGTETVSEYSSQDEFELGFESELTLETELEKF